MRWRWPLLVACAALLAWIHWGIGSSDWHFFDSGSRLLLGGVGDRANGPGGLHLYANYPELQIGPLSLLIATPFRLLGPAGKPAVQIALMALVLGLLALAERLRSDRQEAALVTLIAGPAVLFTWVALSIRYAHLDDALVMTFGLLAVLAARRERALSVGILLACAVAAKPWAAAFLPLALAVRPRWRVLGVALGGSAATYLPFLLADPATIGARVPNLPVSPASVISVLGLAGSVPPAWVRPGQLLLGLLLGIVVVQLGKPYAVLLTGVIARLLLEPGVFDYYTSGLMLAVLVFEQGRQSRFPIRIWLVQLALVVPVAPIAPATARGVARLLVLGALLGFALLARRGASRPAADAPGGWSLARSA